MLSTIRIFISSPGDVADERQIAGRVIEQIQGKYWSFVRLDDVFWEDRAVRATAHYQDELIDPASCEIVVGILWSRLGSPLPERFRGVDGLVPTGTEWELESAFTAYEKSLAETGDPITAKPDILIYRREPFPPCDAAEAQEQAAKLERYFTSHFLNDDAHRTIKRAFLPYRSLESFEELFRKHLEELVLRLIPGLKAGYEPPPISGCPFKGLDAFDFEDSDRFFGRNRQIRDVQQQLAARRQSGPAFVLIYGASGYGKSSLMRAGLAPTLTRPGGLVEKASTWRRIVFQPAQGQGSLSEKFTRELVALLGDSWDVARILRNWDDAEDYIFVAAALQDALECESAQLLLQVDQLEEVFTESLGADERAALFRGLYALCSCSRVWGLATMRSEFFPRVAEQPGLARLVGRDGGYILPPPDAQMLSEIIRFPALAARLEFERSTHLRQIAGEAASAEFLSDQIYNDAKDSPDALPLLEFCLTLLYEVARAEGSDRLTWASYEAIGGLRGAIATVADNTFDALRETQRSDRAVATLFGSLVRVDPTAKTTTRRRADLGELRARPGTAALLDAFLDAKLLVTDEDRAAGQTVVFLAHECLLSHWGRLALWIDEHESDLAAHQRLIEQTELWDTHGGHPSYLLAEGRLGEAQRVAASGMFALTPLQERYLAASLQKARKRLRFFQAAAAVFAVVALAAIALGWVAKQRTAEAKSALIDTEEALIESRRNEGQAWLERARRAAQADPGDAFAAAMMAARAVGFDGFGRAHAVGEDDGFARQFPVLISPENDPELARKARQEVGRYLDAARLPVWSSPASLHHSHFLTELVFSPDGGRLTSIDSNGQVHRWDATSGRRLPFATTQASFSTALALSPDGKRLATENAGTVVLRDAITGTPSGPELRGHWLMVSDIAFSPDGHTLATLGGSDGTVRLWDAATGESVGEPQRWSHGSSAALTFTQDGSSVVVGGGGANLLFLDLAGDRRTIDLASWPTGTLRASGFASGGRTFAAADDSVVRVWTLGDNDDAHEALEVDFKNAATLTFSADGSLLAVGSDAGAIIVVEAASGAVIGYLATEFGSEVFALAISPDGRTLAAGTGAKTVRLWDVTPGKTFATPLNSPATIVNAIAVSPDGSILAEARADGHIQLWNTATFEISRVLEAGQWGVRSVAFSPDGRTIAAGCFDPTVRLWDLADSTANPRELHGHTGTVASVAFSPDGKQLASGGSDQLVHRWNLASGESAGVPLAGHSGEVSSVAFSPDGKQLASGSADKSVRLWDAASGEPLAKPMAGSTAAVNAIAFSPTQRRLASTGDDGFVRLWDPATGEPLGQPISAHAKSIYGHNAKAIHCLAFSPDGRILATGSRDKSVRFWDMASGATSGQPIIAHADTLLGLAFAPDGRTLATASRDGTLRVWDIARPPGRSIKVGADAIEAVAISPDGETLASGAKDGTIQLWDTASGQPLGLNWTGHGERVASLAFSPDGRTLASGSGLAFGGPSQSLRLWEVSSGEAIGEPRTEHAGTLTALAFSPDGKRVASASQDGSVRLWNTTTAQPEGPPLSEGSDGMTSVAFSPDGQDLAAGHANGDVTLWDLSADPPTSRILPGHLGPVTVLAFTSDGRQLASGSDDTTVRLWETASGDGKLLPFGTGYHASIKALSFGADGRELTTLTSNAGVYSWDAASGQPLERAREFYPTWFSSATFSADASTIVNGGIDGTLTVYRRDESRPTDLAAYLADGRYVLTESALQSVAEVADNLLHSRARAPLNAASDAGSPLARLIAAGNWSAAFIEFDQMPRSEAEQLDFVRSLIAAAANECRNPDSARVEIFVAQVSARLTPELIRSESLALALIGLATDAAAADRDWRAVFALLDRAATPLPLELMRSYADLFESDSPAKLALDRRIVLHADAPAEALIVGAWSLVTFEAYPEAIAAFQRAAVRVTPDAPSSFLLLGLAAAHWRDGQKDAAIATYHQLRGTDPSWASAEGIIALDWQKDITATLQAIRAASLERDPE